MQYELTLLWLVAAGAFIRSSCRSVILHVYERFWGRFLTPITLFNYDHWSEFAEHVELFKFVFFSMGGHILVDVQTVNLWTFVIVDSRSF